MSASYGNSGTSKQVRKWVSIVAEGVGKSAIVNCMLVFYNEKAKTTPAAKVLKCQYALVVYSNI